MTTKTLWFARIVKALVIVFLAFDSVIHIMQVPQAMDAFARLGIPANVAVPIGFVELACLALYVIPQTAVLGAMLLTGYLGGAVLANARIEAPLFSTILFPVYLGIFMWGALWLMEPRLRALAPLRK